ncbi:possible bacteriophage DNA primase [Psychrobacter arcticus 273-4]|uniref:Possible bacteriophage DNA primase n=1 Tax=Psychrobacter arcticus (strain DSM 17307 / VKM B-2377 / 273-4) TaxID=259536 RepID=Q4FUH6_PSYA2|nr:primase-helicase zinc-binding domain-containing protein [Psychrobacter arcticus]AAZ18332.1 possible bacteriophage DNA primase [Psychrobacter arcticus 273-4]
MSDKRTPLDFEAIRAGAVGNYVSTIFPAAGIAFSKPAHQHQACPMCGGSNRFRCDDKRGEGTWICSQCGAGNGFMLVKEFTGLDVHETNKLIAGAIGLDASSEVTDEQRIQWQSQQVEREAVEKAEKRQARIDAASRAQSIWDNAKPAADDHPYLLRKNVSAIGLSQDANDNLIIPMYYHNADKQQITLVNVQTIAPDSDKLFLKGGLVSGAYFTIGSPAMFSAGIILICEGYATGATVFDAMSYSLPVIVAFNAHNLIPVTQSIRAQYPDHRIIICADDDSATAIKMRDKDIAAGKEPKPLVEYNAGIRDAKLAALAVNGELVVPSFDMSDIDKDAA